MSADQPSPALLSTLVRTQADPHHARLAYARGRLRHTTGPLVAVATLLLAILAVAIVSRKGANHSRSWQGSKVAHSPVSAGSFVVDVAGPGAPFSRGAIGLSIEADELATSDLNSAHRSLVALMRLLGPAVLRIGGNSLDRSWWTTHTARPPAWATSVVTPTNLVALRGLLAATGWRVILGVDLGHFAPLRAANEVHVAQRVLGPRLLGIEIGNEPNDYGSALDHLRPSSYTVTRYLDELAVYEDDIRALSPQIRFYGPDVSASPTWLRSIASTPIGAPFAALTQHYYATTYSIAGRACQATSVPTASDLLSQSVRQEENRMLLTLTGAGRLAHRSTLITETNTTASCDVAGGPDTSPVFASALWSLDWALRAARAGVAGLNFHGYFGRCAPNAFSPICAPTAHAEAEGHVIARPEYYGLLAARQLEGGYFIPVRTLGYHPLNSLSIYATRHSDGAVSLAIDNFDARRPTLAHIQIPGYHHMVAKALTAPSITSTTGIRFIPASLGSHVGEHGSPSAASPNGRFNIIVPSSSAAIVTLYH